MYYKQFGTTDMRVSAVGMGAMRFAKEDVQADRLDKCAQLVLYAHEKGINYFDTAPTYNDGKSEKILGMAFSQLKRDSFYAASKSSYICLERPVTEEIFMARLQKTLEDMKLDYLDFYLLWGMITPKQYGKQRDALMGFFEKAKAQGLVKHIGVSSHMEGEELMTLLNDGGFDGLQVGYNVLNYRYRQTGLAEAYRKGVGVMVMNPLGGGLIPRNPQFFEYLTKDTDLTVAQAALRFVLAHREITVALNGFSCEQEVDDAVKAAEGLVEEPAAQIAAKYEGQGVAFNDLCTGCNYCTGCPQGVPVSKYMDVYNEILLGGDPNFRMMSHWGVKPEGAAQCVACGQCEERCTQHLPIIERLKEVAKLAK